MHRWVDLVKNIWVRIGLLTIASFLVLMLASGLVLRGLVGGSIKDWFVAAFETRTGSKVAIGSTDFDLLRWIIFRPAVTLHDVSIANPPGFAAGNLLEAKTVTARISLLPLFRKKVNVESMSFDQPHVVVIGDDHGHTNLEVFVRTASRGKVGTPANPPAAPSKNGSTPGPPPPRQEAVLSVNDLSVKSGSMVYDGTKDLDLRDITLRLRGFCRDEPCRIEASAIVWGGKGSGLKVNGHIGPFSPDSLPLDGNWTLTLALAEMPPDLRRDRFRSILAAPGDDARFVMESSVKGDVYQSVAGPTKLTLTSVQIGNDPAHLMPLSGQAPGTLTATALMTGPVFKIEIPDAGLQLGKGQWKGSADLTVSRKSIAGGVRGSIRDLEVNQFLSAFTTARDKIYGTLAMPSLELRFAGANGLEIAGSIKGTGKLSVTDGRLSMLDFPSIIQKVLGRAETQGASGSTSFSSLTADLNIGGRKINATNLDMQGTAARLTGGGVIDFDHTINFDVVARVDSGKIVKIGPIHLPSINVDVPLEITGTVEKPKVQPKLGKLPGDVVKPISDAVKSVEGAIRKNRKSTAPARQH